MSLQYYRMKQISAIFEKRRRGKEKLKRPSAGTGDRGEGPIWLRDPEIGPPSAPAHGDPPHGQESNAT